MDKIHSLARQQGTVLSGPLKRANLMKPLVAAKCERNDIVKI